MTSRNAPRKTARVIGGSRTTAGRLVAAAMACALSTMPGCAFAVEHPAVAGGVVGGAVAFGTCKLASDNYGTCAIVGGGAGAFLALVAAAAVWLGGDGHSVMVEEQAQPLPEDSRPRHRRPPPPDDPATGPVPAPRVPASPAPASPAPASPTPASPAPSNSAPAPASTAPR